MSFNLQGVVIDKLNVATNAYFSVAQSFIPAELHFLLPTFGFCLLMALYCFVRSEVSKNYSVVDRLWSIVPILYAWLHVFQPVLKSKVYKNSSSFLVLLTRDFKKLWPLLSCRGTAMAVLVTLWGLRLTWNFHRKGGYKRGEEDYRWPVLRTIIKNKFLWSLFSFFFIAVYQNILLYLLTLPIAFAVRYGGTSHLSSKWDIYDYICTAVFLALLAGETIADNQQWVFQTQKHALLRGGDATTSNTPLRRSKRQTTVNNTLSSLPGPYSLGFITTGLFQYSRHPNFFCEICLWFTQLAFISSRPGFTTSPFVTAATGSILLFLLFLGSTKFTEWISAQKYPKYKEYQKTTSKLIPWLPGPRLYEEGALKPSASQNDLVESTPTKKVTRSARGTPRSTKKKD